VLVPLLLLLLLLLRCLTLHSPGMPRYSQRFQGCVTNVLVMAISELASAAVLYTSNNPSLGMRRKPSVKMRIVAAKISSSMRTSGSLAGALAGKPLLLLAGVLLPLQSWPFQLLLLLLGAL
jgi:ABC-type transport system involved in cytochrome c biogenesis permease subunit